MSTKVEVVRGVKLAGRGAVLIPRLAGIPGDKDGVSVVRDDHGRPPVVCRGDLEGVWSHRLGDGIGDRREGKQTNQSLWLAVRR